MKKSLSDYLIAITVIACSAVLLGALGYALAGWKAPSTVVRAYSADFADVTGIRIHSQVRYAGAPAGSVIGVRLLTADERAGAEGARRANAVRVDFALDPDVPALPGDVRVFLSSDTMLSEKFLAISAGTPGLDPLPEGTVMQGISGAGLDAVLEKIGPLITSLEPVLASLKQAIDGIDPLLKKTTAAVDNISGGINDALPRISKLADSLKVTSESADSALKRIDKLVGDSDPLIKEDLTKLKTALATLDTTLKSADRLVGDVDKKIDVPMRDLTVVLQNLKVATTHAKAAFETIGEHPSRLIFKGKPNKLPSEDEILRASRPVPGKKAEAARR